jgi:hypothetical protein
MKQKLLNTLTGIALSFACLSLISCGGSGDGTTVTTRSDSFVANYFPTVNDGNAHVIAEMSVLSFETTLDQESTYVTIPEGFVCSVRNESSSWKDTKCDYESDDPLLNGINAYIDIEKDMDYNELEVTYFFLNGGGELDPKEGNFNPDISMSDIFGELPSHQGARQTGSIKYYEDSESIRANASSYYSSLIGQDFTCEVGRFSEESDYDGLTPEERAQAQRQEKDWWTCYKADFGVSEGYLTQFGPISANQEIPKDMFIVMKLVLRNVQNQR